MSAADHPALSGPTKQKVCPARREVFAADVAAGEDAPLAKWLLDCVADPEHEGLHKDIWGRSWDNDGVVVTV